MNLLASIVLLGWIPIGVLPLFAALPARRAVIVAFIVAWLFLPNGGFSLPGLPDFTKVTATSLGVLLGGFLFNPGPLFALRPRWRDIPIAVLCSSPFASSMTNNLGAYDGTSAVVSQTITYGLPYLIARAYLADSDGVKDLAIGIVIGGLIYVPFCLWEMRMSPQLQETFYGRGRFFNSMRYGGYRPLVFMADGLEVGMWMTGAALIACWMWTGGTVKKIMGWAFGPLASVLLVTAIFCRSTGAIVQMVLGLFVLWSSRRFRSVVPAVVLAAIPVLYCGSRSLGLWDGRAAVELTNTYLSNDRAGSLEFRLDNEDMLIGKALQRPVFGWGGWGRARVFNEDGRDLTVTDGLWIIALGNQGFVGLASHCAVLTMPILVLVARCPARRWKDPDVAPMAALAVLLDLYMIDNISNAMFNPIYYLAAGAILSPRAFVGDAAGPFDSRSGAADGHFEPARNRAEELEGKALSLGEGWHEVSLAWRRVIDASEASGMSDRDRAAAECRLGLALARLSRWREAIETLECAVSRLSESDASRVDDVETMQSLAEAMVGLSRLYSTSVDPAVRDPRRAVDLASRASRMAPGKAAYYNALGAAFLRAGEWSCAVAAIGRSIALGRRGGTRSDHSFLAIAYANLGDRAAARTSLSEAALRASDAAADPEEMSDLLSAAVLLMADDPEGGVG